MSTCECSAFTNKQIRDEQATLAGLEPPEPDSNLFRHAKAELARLGGDNNEIHPDFNNKILEIITIFASMGHSGSSALYTRELVNKLLSHQTLTPITDDPSEWQKHAPELWDGKNSIWQNRRDSRFMSTDAGVTYWNVEDIKRGEQVTTKRSEQTVHGPNGDALKAEQRARMASEIQPVYDR
jgi:hypothetical protein